MQILVSVVAAEKVCSDCLGLNCIGLNLQTASHLTPFQDEEIDLLNLVVANSCELQNIRQKRLFPYNNNENFHN